MAAPYNKFNLFPDDLVKGNMNFGSDVFKILLTNVAPVPGNHVYNDIVTAGGEVANGNGYTTGGLTSAMSVGNVSGLETIMAAAVTWTCAGGPMGPFRYAVIYDSTPPIKTLIGWWDYGSNITLAIGQTFTVQPNASPTTGNLFTLQ